MNKREFVLSSCAGLLGSTLTLAAQSQCLPQSLPTLDSAHSLAGWQAWVGQSFEAIGRPGLSLQLLSVQSLSAQSLSVQSLACTGSERALQQFHLNFAVLQEAQAPAQEAAMLGDQILQLRHAASDQSTALFLQAITATHDGCARLQASFSLLS